MLQAEEVYPMDSRYVLYFDEYGYSFTLGTDASHVRRPLRKRSLNSNVPDRSLKKHSSNWCRANKSDNNFKSVTCKEQEIFCAAGMRGKKCMRFPGLTKDECPMSILVVEIKGLGLAQDLNPNSNITGYVIFSQRKENFSRNNVDDEEDASISVRVRHFILQKVIIPFAHELRDGNPIYDIASKYDAICDRMQSVLCLDSDILFLSLLKREEIEQQMIKERINVGKCAAGFTECSSSCDKSRLFSNTKFNQKRESIEQIETALHANAKNALTMLAKRKMLNLSAWKFNTCVDCIASNNIINDTSCKSRKTMQDGFLATEQLSKTMDDKGLNSYQDLYSMINCTKNVSVLNKSDIHELKLCEASRACACKGELDEVELKEFDFDADEDPDDKVSNLTCTPRQCHLIRSIIPYHFYFRIREI